MKTKIRKVALVLGSSCMGISLFLTACGGNSDSDPSPLPVITGKVTDGPNNPIRYAQVTLYSASEYGRTKLGETTSDSSGQFSLSYHLPASGQYVYIVAQGGSVSGSNNPYINLVNVIGTQGNIPSQVVIDELTTVASYQSFSHSWTSTNNPTLLQTNDNISKLGAGFSTYQSLVSPVTGDFTYQYPIGTLTGGQLAAQANTLAPCVQVADNCTYLRNYYNAPYKDTFTLMAYLKFANPSALTNTNTLLTTNQNILPYQTAPSLQQTSLSIIYSNSQFNFDQPYGITVDKNGNIWITNADHNGLTEIKSTSNGSLNVQLYDATEYHLGDNPFGITSDKDGNIWVANHSINTVTELKLNQDGTYTSHVFNNSAGYAFSAPRYLSSDNEGNIWVTNNQNYTVIEIKKNSNGGYSPLIKNTNNVPMGIATDKNGNIWVAESVGSSLIEFVKDQAYAPYPFNNNNGNYSFNRPYGVATDRLGNILVTNNDGNSVTKLYAEAGMLPEIYSGNNYSFNYPPLLAADYDDNIWVTNNGGNGDPNGNGNSITEIINGPNNVRAPYLYDNPSYGFSGPAGIAVDKAGNIWVANSSNNTVTEIIN